MHKEKDRFFSGDILDKQASNKDIPFAFLTGTYPLTQDGLDSWKPNKNPVKLSMDKLELKHFLG